MSPVVIGNATLYLGDCMEILPTLQKVDAVITDPPYGIAYQSGYATPALWKAGDIIYGDSSTLERDRAISMIASRNGLVPMLVFGTWKATRPSTTKMVLVWDKGGALGMGDLTIPWKPDHEEIYVIGGPFTGSRDSGSVLRHPPVQSMAKNGREHPTEKPVRLMLDLLRKTNGTVIDPFMGSGTTGVACAQRGRPFIGIEREPKYFEIACRRIEQAHAQGTLFGSDPPRDPEQQEIAA